jgi:hypothetical protein
VDPNRSLTLDEPRGKNETAIIAVSEKWIRDQPAGMQTKPAEEFAGGKSAAFFLR